MVTITIGGQSGAGGIEIGQAISRQSGVPVIRKLAVRKLARYLNASVEAVVRKELSFSSRKVWLANAAEHALWTMSMYGWEPHVAADTGQWQKPSDRRIHAAQIGTQEYVDAFRDVTAELLCRPSVIVERGGCLSMRNHSTIHIGIFAGMATRIARTAQSMRVGWSEAADIVKERDIQRREWFKTIACTEPEDRSLYDIVYDSTGEYDDNLIADRILHLAAA